MLNRFFLLIFILFIVQIYSQIPENIQYERTLDRCARYEATLLEHNNRLFVDARGAIEEYQILDDGSLELITYVSTFNNSNANAVILGDSIFVAVTTGLGENISIYIIDISSSPMQLVNTIEPNSNSINIMSGNEEYFMYNPAADIYSYVYDRNTMEYITQIITGGFYTVNGNYLFYELTNCDSSYLAVSDISDINNIVPIDTLFVGIDEQNMGYYFYDDLLFISQNTQIMILDVSEIDNINVISTISNIPSVPSVNFFTMLLKYSDYLVIGNTETKFWVYNISDIYNPQYMLTNSQFLGGTSNKNSLLNYEDKIYYARTGRNICMMDADELPELNIIEEFGNCGQFQFFDFTYPYLLYSDPFRHKQYCLKINDPEPEPICLADSPNGSVSIICYNDSLICFLTADYNTDNLVICSYDETNIEVSNTIPLGTSNFRDPFFRGEHLILCGFNPGEISINVINPDYSISEVGNFTVGTRSHIIDQTTQCNSDYLFIKSKYNSEYIIEVFENQVPFNQVSSFELVCNNHEFGVFFFLEDDKVLLCDYYAPGGLYYLCDYTFPDNFERIDSFSSNTITFSVNDHYLFGHKDLDGVAEFYTWQNDEISLAKSFNLDVELYNAFLLPDESKLIAGGRYIVQEYSSDFVFVDDNQILDLKNELSNHPNPFNPSTEIRFQISEVSEWESAEIVIYNIRGQKVKQLINEELPAGQHSVIWDGTNDAGKPVASGVYYYQLKAGSQVLQKKALLLK